MCELQADFSTITADVCGDRTVATDRLMLLRAMAVTPRRYIFGDKQHAPLLRCLFMASDAITGLKAVEINGASLAYVEEGDGDPMVFVHGAPLDLRTWEPVRELIVKRYRFIAYTQRYFGVSLWPDDGENYAGIPMLADDLAKLITALNVGPVHLVGWSFGGQAAITAAVQNPSLVRSLILYEGSAISVLPEDTPEGKLAREDRANVFAPSHAASKAGEYEQAARRMVESVFRLPRGGFAEWPKKWQTMVLDNARVLRLLSAGPPVAVTCEMLNSFTRPMLIMEGEETHAHYRLINDRISKCAPNVRRIMFKGAGHGVPLLDPEAFSTAIFEFVSSL
jgi:pimeloyl-ACP methyl ester carboxylesterase